MTNHIEQALASLKPLFKPQTISIEEVNAQLQLAQAYASIAIAEQLRIANLIALKAAWEPVETHATKDCERVYTVKNQIADDIAEALGIGGESDD